MLCSVRRLQRGIPGVCCSGTKLDFQAIRARVTRLKIVDYARGYFYPMLTRNALELGVGVGTVVPITIIHIRAACGSAVTLTASETFEVLIKPFGVLNFV